MHVTGWTRPLAEVGGNTLLVFLFVVRLAHTASICSLAREVRGMPSASSTVAVVE